MELTIDQALQQGVAAHKGGRFQEAERLFQAILQTQPTHPKANHNLGVLWLYLNKTDLAIPLLEIAVKTDPSMEQYWITYLTVLIKQRKFQTAKNVFAQGKARGFFGKKVDALEAQITLTPQAIDSKLQEQKQALPFYNKRKAFSEQKKAQNPSSTNLNNLLKRYQSHNYADAEKLAISNTLQFPHHQFSWKVLAAVLRQTARISDALIANKKSVALAPDDAEAHTNLGNTLKDLGRLQEAQISYRQALQLTPNYAELYINLGITLKELGQLKEAEESCRKAIVLKPHYGEAHYNLGNTLKEFGRLDEAEESYRRAITQRQNFFQAHSNLGATLKELGRLKEAEASYRQAIALKENFFDAHSNLGIMLKELGRLEEAEASCRQAIALEQNSAEAHSNLGITLKELGRLEEAEVSYRQAITLKENFPDAHSNLGITLKELGRLEEAEASYRQAITLKGNFFEAHSNLGNTLKELERLKEAEKSYKKSIVIKPGNSELYNNLGVTLKLDGRLEESILAYKKSLNINNEYDLAYYNMGIALSSIIFSKPIQGLSVLLCKLLEKEKFVRPKDVSKAVISLIKFDPIIKQTLKEHSSGRLAQSLQETIVNLSNIPLLLKLMAICPLPDLEFEVLFKDIRSAILLSVSNIKNNSKILKFQIALSLQCFTNEYLYDQKYVETEALKQLEHRVKTNLDNGKQPKSKELACISSYVSLHECPWSVLLSFNTELKPLYKRQLLEPKLENNLKINIPLLQGITNCISFKVQEQYEQNPYPRWVNIGLPLAPTSMSTIAKELKLRITNPCINKILAPKILIAGCGTGQHSIGTASRFKDSDVLAIDLSLRSLAYAKRKTEELAIPNIQYLQGDILDVGKLNRKFDIIESSGVLHHMGDPMAGWKVLADCLKPGGLMAIGLYSATARRDILQIFDEIKKLNIDSSDAAMKLFRNKILKSNRDRYYIIKLSNDFYSMSTFRDLLFHAQEYQFTIAQIKDGLSKLGLIFCGFENLSIIQKFKSKHLEKNAVYDLEKWEIFEEENPHAFGGMYQFWCQKV